MLVALTPNDELNILSCMTAKKLGTLDVSARIHQPEFDQDQRYIMEEYGIDRLLNPDKEAAKEMLWNIELSGFLRTEAFFDRKAVIVELKVEEDSPLSGRTLPEVKNFFDTDMLVVAVYRKKEIIIPNGNSSIQPGDTVVVVTDVNNVLDELDDIFIIS